MRRLTFVALLILVALIVIPAMPGGPPSNRVLKLTAPACHAPGIL